MTSVESHLRTLDEFLALPETEAPALEFLRGEVTEKPMAAEIHGVAVIELGSRIREHLRARPVGRVVTEVRHAARDQAWVFLPDLSVRLRRSDDEGPVRRGPVEAPPEFAVEVLSPDDCVSRWLERVNLYMAAGTQLLWVIDPEDESIVEYRPGQPASTCRAGSVLTARPVLPEFTLDVREYFSAIREG